MNKKTRYREAVKSTLAYLLRSGYGRTQQLKNEALYVSASNGTKKPQIFKI
jgi:hypothetical protein